MVLVNCSKRFIPFLTRGLTRTKSPKQIKEEADKIELPLFLILNGIPERMVDHATLDQLLILQEIVSRKKFSANRDSDANVIQTGVAHAFGSDDKN